MIHQTFHTKWDDTEKKTNQEEQSIFVDLGKKPVTQRQVNLYYYYQFIKSIIDKKEYKDAIEIGCGRGTIALYLALYERMNVICNDVEEKAIDIAKQNFSLHKQKATFIVGDAAKLPIPDQSVDVAVSIGLLEHLENYQQILQEQYRILRPGGVMISLNIPKKYSVQKLNNIYRFFLKLFHVPFPLKKDYFRNSDTPEMYATAAKKENFENVFTLNVNPFPIFTPIPYTCEKYIAAIYRMLLKIRSFFLSYPMKTNYFFSQAHFLVGFKKKNI